MNIPDEAVDAAAAAIQVRLNRNIYLSELARVALEAAAPYLIAHERQLTADAHRDAIVNRDTADRLETEIQKLREESKKLRDAAARRLMAGAWDEGHLDAVMKYAPTPSSGVMNNPYRSAGAGE